VQLSPHSSSYFKIFGFGNRIGPLLGEGGGQELQFHLCDIAA
jgi:hypothetical protein